MTEFGKYVLATVACGTILLLYVIACGLFEWKRGGGAIPMLMLLGAMTAAWKAITGYGRSRKEKIDGGDGTAPPRKPPELSEASASDKNTQPTESRKDAEERMSSPKPLATQWLIIAVAAVLALTVVVVAFIGLITAPSPASPAASREHAIERTPVRSSALRSVGYDQEHRVLEVEFTGGEVYRYFDVAAEVFRGLMAAESHGRYFHQHVRNKGYRYRRIN